MMQIHRLQFAVALLVFSVAVIHVDGQECARGSTQCKEGYNTVNINNQTVCCLNYAQYPSIRVSKSQSLGCTCDELTLEVQKKRILEFVKRTDGDGRMCQSGNDNCRGVKTSITVYDRFTFCCRNPFHSDFHYTIVGTSYQDTACRCSYHSIPTNPDPQAYVVPQTTQYSTTGENCSYNELCNDNPNLKCESPYATMCCYGSRGIQLTNAGNVTLCTCTHDFFGTNCTNIQPLPVCLQQCSTVTDSEKKCVIGNGQDRCCPPSLTVNATVYNGNFTSCTCTRDLLNKVCSTQDAVRSMVGPVVNLWVGLMAAALLLALAVY